MLAQRFGVSVGTIRRAVEGLEEMGVVTRRQGRGTFVAGLTVTAAERLQRICSPKGDTLRLIRTTVQSLTRTGRPEELTQFQTKTPADVIEVISTVTVGKVVIGVEHSVLCGSFLPGVEAALGQGSDVYAALGSAGIILTRAEDQVSLTTATSEVAETLSVAIGTPMLHVARKLFTVTGEPAEVSVGSYLASVVAYRAVS